MQDLMHASDSKRRTHRRAEGFTLLELIVVITIIGILATAVVVNVTGTDDKARVARVRQDFSAIKTAASMYKSDHTRYPETLQELMNPPATRDGRQPKYLDNEPLDPWTNEYYFYERTQNGSVRVWSFGADQSQGGTGFDEDLDSENIRQ